MTQSNFDSFGLNPQLLSALKAAGYETPTPIQTKAIPDVMAGKDLLGIAQTGTGKTAAFALPILHRLAANRTPPVPRTTRCLVLSPTRELATQIAESFKTYGKNLGFRVAVIFGGVKYGGQERALNQGLDILVAAPGRLLDHIQQKNIDLSATEIFVLDEADQMLDLGFIKPIRQITSRLPARRQNLFFSATMPSEIGKLAGELLKDPVKVQVTPQATTVERIQQSVIWVEQGKKRALLTELFSDPAYTRCLVFTKTKHGADKVAAYLEAGGVEAGAIHGNKSQPQRERALEAFKTGKLRVLVATDIAARGIDVDKVTHVVNFELPHVPESYVHRIGRTARAGKDGTAISFVAGDEMKLLRDVEKLTRQKIPAIDRRNDKQLAGLDAVIMASGVGKKASIDSAGVAERDEQQNRGRGRGRRQGERPPGGGQPHRARKPGGPGRDRTHHAERPAKVFDPLAGERVSSERATPSAPKPEGEMKRRPRRRKPSNGGKGYAAKA
ncbi:MAG: DEAD/DEAH box helicase [Alphaproteobacteria bacterium]|nr:DEAD/DEAH box helicase [Alphaproteobacteria bacterium]MBU1525374.1 DEAD/DEAH box helicase [Alphaproteobacteria bacterium]MBU2117904.1 DEAD/DEAH box helicase [Alphaproteobacteria bacterium]MBU2352474.1 DEAD/DEAH box helicase [Alphaproteobacteria bacterium]MBU2382395.1 DEAD/DEAH box helicase [Alphaproteobacteria bacterium]